MFKTVLSGQMFDELPVWDHLTAAVESGYDGVQLRSTHVTPQTPAQTIAAIRSFIREKNMAVNGLSCFTGNYGLLDRSECEKAFEEFMQFTDLAARLDSPMIRVWPGWHESATASLEVWTMAAEWMRKSADYAAGNGVKIAMEMHHGTLCDTADSAVRLLEMIARVNVGVIFDPVNLYQALSDYGPAAIQKLGDRIFDVHVKDIIRLSGDYFPYAFKYSYYVKHIGRFTRVVPPQIEVDRFYCHRRINHGGIDWSSVIVGLKKINYNGYFSVESVRESNLLMPDGRELAALCRHDIMQLFKALEGNLA